MTIIKKTDSSYTITLNAITPHDKLTITYLDQKTFHDKRNESIKKPESRTIVKKFESSDITKELSLPVDISDIFDDELEKALSVFDDYNKTLYREFMESIVDTNLDDFIDATDYGKAFATLKEILDTNKKYKEMPTLKSLIDKKDLKPSEKMLIVDRFKAIFSFVLPLTNGKDNGKYLSTLIDGTDGRGSVYKTLR